MSLGPEDRGVLEKIIDGAIMEIPTQMLAFRDPRIMELMAIKEQNDLIIGMALGYIVGRFLTYFFANHIRVATFEELLEVYQVVLKRSAELRSAIFKPE